MTLFLKPVLFLNDENPFFHSNQLLKISFKVPRKDPSSIAAL